MSTTSQPADLDPSLQLSKLMFPSVVPCIAVAARYGIADRLTDGPRGVDVLAKEAGVDADALYGTLQLLTEEGIFSETGPRVFANTPLSLPLRTGVDGSLRTMARLIAEPWLWSCWERLDHSVTTGEPAFDEVFGTSMWEFFDRDPAASDLFNEALSEFSTVLGGPVARAHPALANAHTVADLGGGHGAFLAAVLRAYPTIKRGLLVDQPTVVAGAGQRSEISSLRDAGRLDVVPSDFFHEVPGGVDVYLTKQVLPSWGDDQVVELLRRCREASPNARFVAAEVVRGSDVSRFAKDYGLMMLVTRGDNMRSVDDFRALYRRAGYRLDAVTPAEGTPLSLLSGEPN